MDGFPPSTEALERTRQRAERRARNRRLIAASVVLALAATTLSGLWAAFRLGEESRPAARSGGSAPAPSPSSSVLADHGVCPPPTLEASYLPPDFRDRAWPGAGAWAATGTPPPHPDDAGAIHYRGADRGRFVEIRRRSAEEISLVHYPEGPLEEVLGQPAISGPSSSSLRAYAVEFAFGRGRCPVHVVLGAGVTSEEVERFAEGLRVP